MNTGYRRLSSAFVRVFVPVSLVVPFHLKTRGTFSFMDHENAPMSIVPKVLEETKEETAFWEEKGKICSFCAFFLGSPCAAPFKKWALCADKAKEGISLYLNLPTRFWVTYFVTLDEDNIQEICGDLTKQLLLCQCEHRHIFFELDETDDEDDRENRKDVALIAEVSEDGTKDGAI